MHRLRPVTGHVVAPDHAARVVPPPREAIDGADPGPDEDTAGSFAGVLAPYGAADAATLAACRAHLDRLLASGAYRPLRTPVLGVLELDDGEHRLTGVVGDLPAAAVADGTVRPHEETRPDRVAALRGHLAAVGAASSPVHVAHRSDAALARLLDELRRAAPDVALDDRAGRLRLWLVAASAARDELAARVAATSGWLLADGHHRAEAARRWGDVLAVLVPDDGLSVLAFHRRLPMPEPATAGTRLRARGLAVTEVDGAPPAPAAGEVVVAGGGRVWRVSLPPAATDDPVADLEVTRAHDAVIAPLLAAGDHDGAAVEAVAPTRHPAALVRPGTAVVLLPPPSLARIRAVAEAGRTMPPKSTYVAPKQRPGVLVVPRLPSLHVSPGRWR